MCCRNDSGGTVLTGMDSKNRAGVVPGASWGFAVSLSVTLCQKMTRMEGIKQRNRGRGMGGQISRAIEYLDRLLGIFLPPQK